MEKNLINLSGKTALITGASDGIGKEIAICLASRGANIAVHYCKSAPESTLEAIHKFGVRGISIQADFTQGIESSLSLYHRAMHAFGSLDILVNNAGVLYSEKVIDTSESQFDEIFLVNAKTTYFLCKEAIKNMPSGGRIVNISTGGTKMMLGHFSAYLSSKSAVEQITRSIAVEAGEKSITINAIAPGATKTKMLDCFSSEALDHLAKNTPLKRLGQASDIAKVAAFLCSDEASWITGQVIYANGGLI